MTLLQDFLKINLVYLNLHFFLNFRISNDPGVMEEELILKLMQKTSRARIILVMFFWLSRAGKSNPGNILFLE